MTDKLGSEVKWNKSNMIKDNSADKVNLRILNAL